MQLTNSSGRLLAAGLCLLALNALAFGSAAQAKTKKKRSAASHAYLVPPPPAYQPSILPELQGQGDAVQAQTSDTPENHWSKYIYVRPGATAPNGVQANKYVKSWNNK